MITKEKNLIKIIDENQKEWVYDINLGKWIQGDTNQYHFLVRFVMYTDNRTSDFCRFVALSNCNFNRTYNIDRIIMEFYPSWWCNEFAIDHIRYIDKCISANLPCLMLLKDYSPEYKTIMTHLNEYTELVKNIVVGGYNKLCPDLPRYYITEPLPEYDMDDRVENIVAIWSCGRYVLDIIRKYMPHYEKQFNELDQRKKSNLYELLNDRIIRNNTRYYETALYYFFKLTPYYDITRDCVIIPILKYIEHCDFLKIPPRKESNFMKLLVDVDKEYQIKKREFNEQLLVERYAPHLDNLAFENDKYIIVIPQTEEEFAEEARVQRNCVYSSYYPCVVAEQDSGMRIVFMRKKEDINTPYVTIEVELKSGRRVEQALQRNNKDVESREAMKFLEEYEKHLQTYYPTTHNDDDDNCEVTWEF